MLCLNGPVPFANVWSRTALRHCQMRSKLAGARQPEHFWYAARLNAPVIADFISYLRGSHTPQVLFNQLFRFLQPFDLSDHLLLISFMVNPVNLIVIAGRAIHSSTPQC